MTKKSKDDKARLFSAPLERLRSGLGWIVVRIPFDVASVGLSRARPKVRGEINGFPFRTSLFPTREGTHFMLINKRMQKGARVHEGVLAQIRLEPDTEERVVEIPAELKRALSGERALLRWFEKLSYSIRKWIVDQINDANSAETRRRRSERIAEQLLSAMEAERELPPMIQMALSRNARAREGWARMSPKRRRGELLAIFHYRTFESQMRRLEKTLEEAVCLAQRPERRTPRR